MSGDRTITDVDGFAVTLKAQQVEHFTRTCDILEKDRVALDLSMMGCGKTFVAYAVAAARHSSVLIFCPASAEDVWWKIGKLTNSFIYDIISYDMLPGKRYRRKKRDPPGEEKKPHVLTHQLLVREDEDYEIITKKGDVVKKTKTIFTPTEKLERLLTYGTDGDRPILVIYDEAHKVKNGLKGNKAAAEINHLLHTIDKGLGYKNRIMILSGTLFDKEEHACNILKIMDYYIEPHLFEMVNNQHKGTGILEIYESCKLINEAKADEIWHNEYITASNVHHMCFRFFVEIVMPYCASNMPPLSQEGYVANNYYANLTDDEYLLLSAGIEKLSKAVGMSDNDALGQRKPDWRKITKALQVIESAKMPAMIRLVRRLLNSNPKLKLIVFTNYLDSIGKLQEAFKDVGQVTLQGKVKKSERAALVERFQTDKECRLFLGITSVGGQSLSLDDTVGDSPRVLIAMPDYRIIMLHQASRRHFRLTTKSTATTYFLYGKHHADTDMTTDTDCPESRILDALIEKSSILNALMPFLQTAQVLLPGQYTAYREPPANK